MKIERFKQTTIIRIGKNVGITFKTTRISNEDYHKLSMKKDLHLYDVLKAIKFD